MAVELKAVAPGEGPGTHVLLLDGAGNPISDLAKAQTKVYGSVAGGRFTAGGITVKGASGFTAAQTFSSALGDIKVDGGRQMLTVNADALNQVKTKATELRKALAAGAGTAPGGGGSFLDGIGKFLGGGIGAIILAIIGFLIGGPIGGLIGGLLGGLGGDFLGRGANSLVSQMLGPDVIPPSLVPPGISTIGGPGAAKPAPAAPAIMADDAGMVQVRKPNADGVWENITPTGKFARPGATPVDIMVTKPDGTKVIGHVDSEGKNFVVLGVAAPLPGKKPGNVVMVQQPGKPLEPGEFPIIKLPIGPDGKVNFSDPALNGALNESKKRNNDALKEIEANNILAEINKASSAAEASGAPLVTQLSSIIQRSVPGTDAVKASHYASAIADWYRTGGNRRLNSGGATEALKLVLTEKFQETHGGTPPDADQRAALNDIAANVAQHHNIIANALSAKAMNRTLTMAEATETERDRRHDYNKIPNPGAAPAGPGAGLPGGPAPAIGPTI